MGILYNEHVVWLKKKKSTRCSPRESDVFLTQLSNMSLNRNSCPQFLPCSSLTIGVWKVVRVGCVCVCVLYCWKCVCVGVGVGVCVLHRWKLLPASYSLLMLIISWLDSLSFQSAVLDTSHCLGTRNSVPECAVLCYRNDYFWSFSLHISLLVTIPCDKFKKNYCHLKVVEI